MLRDREAVKVRQILHRIIQLRIVVHSFVLMGEDFLRRKTQMQRELNFCYEVKTHAEKMKDYNKKYRLDHSYEITCRCGGHYKAINKYTHLKSQRHLDFVEKEKQDERDGRCGKLDGTT